MAYYHKEAFCLMWYACNCGHRERIWNSRDGVTPFGMKCPSCQRGMLRHVDWTQDLPTPSHKLNEGQRFWRDGTPNEAEAIMNHRIEQSRGKDYYPSEEARAELLQHARSGGDGSEFQKGWPTLDVHHG